MAEQRVLDPTLQTLLAQAQDGYEKSGDWKPKKGQYTCTLVNLKLETRVGKSDNQPHAQLTPVWKIETGTEYVGVEFHGDRLFADGAMVWKLEKFLTKLNDGKIANLVEAIQTAMGQIGCLCVVAIEERKSTKNGVEKTYSNDDLVEVVERVAA